MAGVRIDKWLWAARFYKTRGLATEAVTGGRVKVNGERVKPAKDVCAGDRVEVRVGDVEWAVVVTGLAGKRGPASAAAALYQETPESAKRREEHARERAAARAAGQLDVSGPRPTKQDRRRLDALRRGARRR